MKICLMTVKCKICDVIIFQFNDAYPSFDLSKVISGHMKMHVSIETRVIETK